MRISDLSSDVCSSDLHAVRRQYQEGADQRDAVAALSAAVPPGQCDIPAPRAGLSACQVVPTESFDNDQNRDLVACESQQVLVERSEEHTSELQSLMRISYAVFCLKKKK